MYPACEYEVAKKLPIRSDNNQIDFDNYTGPSTSPGWNAAHPDNQINIWQQRFNYWKVLKPRRNTTGCNQFVGQIVRLAGGPYVGDLNLRASLDGAGVPFAWVPADSGATPKTGYVLDFGGEHIGMTYNNPDGSFRHIDGGQGGPGMGFDMIAYGMAPFARSLAGPTWIWCSVLSRPTRQHQRGWPTGGHSPGWERNIGTISALADSYSTKRTAGRPQASTIAVSKARRRDVHHERRGSLHGQVADHRVGRKVDARFRLQLEDDRYLQ